MEEKNGVLYPDDHGHAGEGASCWFSFLNTLCFFPPEKGKNEMKLPVN